MKVSSLNRDRVDLFNAEYLRAQCIADDSGNTVNQLWDSSPVYIEYDIASHTDSEDTQDIDRKIISEEQNSEHSYIVIVSNDKKDASFYCNICNLSFSNKEEVDVHFNLPIHESCKKCDICQKIMGESSYELHMKLHKESFKQCSMKNKTQCQVCDKMVTKTYLKFHMTQHGSDHDLLTRRKTCPICKKSIHINYFNDHMKRMHQKVHTDIDTKLYEKCEICPICDRTVKESNMEQHIEGHSNSSSKLKPRVCDVCGRVFQNYSSFRTHKLTHTGNLKYKCEFCPYRGLHLGLLKIHVRTHTKDYAYECSTCKKRFITKSNLSIHEKRHKPPEFNCLKCDKAFLTQLSLKRHYDVVHLKKKDYKCDLCGKGFGYKDGLNAHEKRAHNKLPLSSAGRLPSYLKQNIKRF